jgi:hypothetical protein
MVKLVLPITIPAWQVDPLSPAIFVPHNAAAWQWFTVLFFFFDTGPGALGKKRINHCSLLIWSKGIFTHMKYTLAYLCERLVLRDCYRQTKQWLLILHQGTAKRPKSLSVWDPYIWQPLPWRSAYRESSRCVNRCEDA